MNKSIKLFSTAIPALAMAAGMALCCPNADAPAEALKTVVSNNQSAIEYTATGKYESYNDFVVVDHQGYAKFIFNEASTQKYIDALNYYAENLDEDINLYSMLVPTAAEWYVPEAYKSNFAKQRDVLDYVWNRTDPRIKKVDIYDKMNEHRDEYLYLKTDHHWTALGGYYGYTVLANVLGFQPMPMDYFTYRDTGIDFVGSIGWNTPTKQLEANPDHLYYFEVPHDITYTYYSNAGQAYTSKGVYKSQWLKDKNKYAYFMGGDLAVIKLQTDVHNGKKLLLMKDSYANTVVPLLTAHYEEIYLIDPRHSNYNVMNIIEENGIKDVLFLNYARVTCLPSFSQQMIELSRKTGGGIAAIK
ncbi:MAG: DHHW family protein [Bacillota bacterium]|jgi:hypothetical protein